MNPKTASILYSTRKHSPFYLIGYMRWGINSQTNSLQAQLRIYHLNFWYVHFINESGNHAFLGAQIECLGARFVHKLSEKWLSRSLKHFCNFHLRFCINLLYSTLHNFNYLSVSRRQRDTTSHVWTIRNVEKVIFLYPLEEYLIVSTLTI